MFIELTDLHTGDEMLINMNIISVVHDNDDGGSLLILADATGQDVENGKVFATRESRKEIMQKIKEAQANVK